MNNPACHSEVYTECMRVYYDWHNTVIGFKPKIDGGDGKGLKEIIKYLEGLDDQVDTVTLFKYVLSRWDELSDFYKQQTRLRQINSNIHNVIYTLYNGQATKEKYGVSEAYLRGLIDD